MGSRKKQKHDEPDEHTDHSLNNMEILRDKLCMFTLYLAPSHSSLVIAICVDMSF